MQKILLCLLLLTKFAYSFESNNLRSENIYPFDDKSELSWTEFEKDFRKKYAQLDIPQIKVPTFGNSHSSASYHPGIQTHFFSNLNTPAKINFDPYASLSSHNAEWTLLHEIGHHKYNTILRDNNTKHAKKMYETYYSFTNCTLSLAEKILMMANGYHILFKKPHIKMLLGQGIAKALLERSESFYKETVFKFYADKPEEMAADSFANQHASKEALEAAAYSFSRKGHCEKSIKEILNNNNYLIQEELKKQKPNKALIEKSENIITGVQFIQKYCMNSIGTYLYVLDSWNNCFSHGTFYERKKSILKTYKDRFNL